MPVTRRVSDVVYAALRERLPWLVAEWNGAEWESERTIVRRRLSAMEAHFASMEERYGELESRFLDHAQGARHRRPKDALPEPDQE